MELIVENINGFNEGFMNVGYNAILLSHGEIRMREIDTIRILIRTY